MARPASPKRNNPGMDGIDILSVLAFTSSSLPAVGIAGCFLVGCPAKLCCPHRTLRGLGILGPGKPVGMEVRLPVPLGIGRRRVFGNLWDIRRVPPEFGWTNWVPCRCHCKRLWSNRCGGWIVVSWVILAEKFGEVLSLLISPAG